MHPTSTAFWNPEPVLGERCPAPEGSAHDESAEAIAWVSDFDSKRLGRRQPSRSRGEPVVEDAEERFKRLDSTLDDLSSFAFEHLRKDAMGREKILLAVSRAKALVQQLREDLRALRR
jgi:hypothetical protein